MGSNCREADNVLEKKAGAFIGLRDPREPLHICFPWTAMNFRTQHTSIIRTPEVNRISPVDLLGSSVHGLQAGIWHCTNASNLFCNGSQVSWKISVVNFRKGLSWSFLLCLLFFLDVALESAIFQLCSGPHIGEFLLLWQPKELIFLTEVNDELY